MVWKNTLPSSRGKQGSLIEIQRSRPLTLGVEAERWGREAVRTGSDERDRKYGQKELPVLQKIPAGWAQID